MCSKLCHYGRVLHSDRRSHRWRTRNFRRRILHVHGFYLGRIVTVHHRTLHLQRIGQLSFFHAERLGQQRDALHLFIMGKLLLQGIDTEKQHLVDVGIPAQIRRIGKTDMMAFGKIFQQIVFGNDKRRYELSLVGNHYNLVDVTVYHQFRLYHLRSMYFPLEVLNKSLIRSVRNNSPFLR